jgi:hypothetical protein
MPRIQFDFFSVDTPDGWRNISESVESTLARDNGVGALQIAIELYLSGTVANPTPQDLLAMVEHFAKVHKLGKPLNVALESKPIRLAAASYNWNGAFLRLWQVSDGGNFAFVTYTCDARHSDRELPDCEAIVRSLVFKRD